MVKQQLCRGGVVMWSVWRTGLRTAAGLGRAEVADADREQRRRVRTKPHLEFMSFKRTEKKSFLGILTI